MERKIFDERGFLSKEGKTFINEGFTKEVRRIIATAQNNNDVLVIGSILKSIVGEIAFEATSKFHTSVTDTFKVEDKKPSLKLIKNKNWNDVVPFPQTKSSQELLSLLTNLSDHPVLEDTDK